MGYRVASLYPEYSKTKTGYRHTGLHPCPVDSTISGSAHREASYPAPLSVERGNKVGFTLRPGCGVDGRGSIPDRGLRFSLLHCFQTGYGAHAASYSMGTGVSFRGDKATGA
jgi:hypothetical protein